MRRLAPTLLVMFLALNCLALPMGASDAPREPLITLANLPSGWRMVATATPSGAAGGSCQKVSSRLFSGRLVRIASFTQGAAIPSLSEIVVTGHDLKSAWATYQAGLRKCRNPHVTIGAKSVALHVSTIPFPAVSLASAALLDRFSTSGLRFGTESVSVLTASSIVFVVYSDLGTPNPTITEDAVEVALARLQGRPAALDSNLSVTSASPKVAVTNDGDVEYREVGAGPPLLMIMGYAAPMEVWDRRLVDSLAKHFRVIIFDNAGIGETSSLPRPLTIDEMAQQTSALISRLGFRSVDLLGWSMGGMIAQTLSVLHPFQVRRLILCATFPGVGNVVRPSQARIASLTTPSSPLASTDLFPKNRRLALEAYELANSSYPAAPSTSEKVIQAQNKAIIAWWGGRDPAARRVGSLDVATLIVDGRDDKIDATANDNSLKGLIPDSTLTLYSDAGHAFLFQDWQEFSNKVTSFLAGH